MKALAYKARFTEVSSEISSEISVLEASDCVVVVTDDTTVDYRLARCRAPLVFDTRGITRGVRGSAKVLGLGGAETNQVVERRAKVAVSA